jgi:hypothetical protein
MKITKLFKVIRKNMTIIEILMSDKSIVHKIRKLIKRML